MREPTDREIALQTLARCASSDNVEAAHEEADAALCKLLITLGYRDVVDAYAKVSKWYA